MIWFGRFGGKSVEQVVLLPGGYQFLSWLRRETRNESHRLHRPKLLQLIEEIFQRGEDLPVVVKCRCGKRIATHTSDIVDYTGRHTFTELFCPECKEEVPLDKPYPLPIKLSSTSMIPQDLATQERLLKQFKFSLFGEEKIVITKPRAHKIFFPEFYEESDKDKVEKNRRGRNSTGEITLVTPDAAVLERGPAIQMKLFPSPLTG